MTSVERNAYRREPTSVRAAALCTSQHRCSRYAQDYVGDKSPRLCCHTSAFGCVGSAVVSEGGAAPYSGSETRLALYCRSAQ